ncbi:MAG: hypothetical protein ACYS7M_00080 [Planctomycetota bacterium]|jgi:hypothetical protein
MSRLDVTDGAVKRRKPKRICGSRPTRRTKAEIDAIKASIYAVARADHPVTIRQIFYRLVSAGAIGKTEAEYKSTVGRLAAVMRREGDLPFDWVADNTRWMRKPTTHSNVGDFLSASAYLYRRSLWDDQDAYVEIWLEKEALAGVLDSVTREWDVPLMVTRGYPSLTYLHSAAEQIHDIQRPAYLYYFGDWDPSGVDISRHVEEQVGDLLCEMEESSFDPAEMHFERVAVTAEQIDGLSLPTRPTKKTDSRSRNFEGESVEVDAIPPPTLREIARKCIERHVDRRALEATKNIEAEERKTLRDFHLSLKGGAA